jgi:hypothetical protein
MLQQLVHQQRSRNHLLAAITALLMTALATQAALILLF